LGRVALSFDCAIYFHKFNDCPASAAEPVEGGNLLLALREDKESLLSHESLAPNPAMNQDISLTKGNLDDWIDVIAQASTVVTDRLHVAFASVLLGKRLIYLDPNRLKISNCFNFTFRDTFDDRVQQCSAAWLAANGFALKRGAV
jgi:exopolysaccharide biosynthesis predicted pyruvyltransferase EpsI